MTRLALAACLLVAASAAASAQVGAIVSAPRDGRGVSPSRTGTAVIQGRVVDAENGLPLWRAQVHIIPPPPGNPAAGLIVTDASGVFAFRSLPAGSYRLAIDKPSYINAQYPDGGQTFRSQFRRVTVADGETVPVTVAISRGGVIAGHVLDASGEPMEYAQLQLFVLPRAGGGRPQQRGGASTNDLGEYRVAHLEAGRYLVRAVPRNVPSPDVIGVKNNPTGAASDQVDAQPAPTFYPGVVSIDQAQPIAVRRGQSVTGVDVTIVDGVVATVSGTVVDSAGQAVGCCGSVSAQPVVSGQMAYSGGAGTGIRPDGTFRLKLAPGEYELVGNVVTRAADGSSTPASERFGRLRLSVGGDLSDLALVVGKGATVSGRVVLDGDGPPPIPVNPNAAIVSFTPAPDSVMCRPGRLQLNVDLTFTIEGVLGSCVARPPGGLGNWSIRSIQYNGREMIDQPMAFESGQELRDVRVVLSDRHAGVTIHATDDAGTPAADFVALLFPAEQSHRSEGSPYFRAAVLSPPALSRTEATPARSASLLGMLPGDYLAIALDDVELDWSHDLALIEQLVPAATHVTIADGAPAEITLRRQKLADLVPER